MSTVGFASPRYHRLQPVELQFQPSNRRCSADTTAFRLWSFNFYYHSQVCIVRLRRLKLKLHRLKPVVSVADVAVRRFKLKLRLKPVVSISCRRSS
jgi:hypothetical protein